jgi:hypothetical protein
MSVSTWLRVTAAGVLWSLVYNAVWGAAWFVFMRREWQTAFAAIGRGLAWTPAVWLVWVLTTIPLGVVLMSYAARSVDPRRAGVRAALAVFLIFALGMSVWGLQEALSLRVLGLDAMVNAVAMAAATLAAVALLPAQRGARIRAAVGSRTRAV